MKIISRLLLVLFLSVTIFACNKDDDDEIFDFSGNFIPLDAPYKLCIGSNPGGIVFDFVLPNGEKGGANYFDYPSAKNLVVDMMIKNVKAETPVGYKGGGGMPHMRLCKGAEAVNYSAIDEKCKGYDAYVALKKADLPELTFKTDDSSFDISKLEKGKSGRPLLSELNKEFKDKLVIGNLWKEPAHNEVAGDEIVWIIKTIEGRYVKMIVTQFPAKDGETVLRGKIAMEWDLLD